MKEVVLSVLIVAAILFVLSKLDPTHLNGVSEQCQPRSVWYSTEAVTACETARAADALEALRPMPSANGARHVPVPNPSGFSSGCNLRLDGTLDCDMSGPRRNVYSPGDFSAIGSDPGPAYEEPRAGVDGTGSMR